MNLSQLKKRLPTTPGVYFMKNAAGKILYVGKAANLKRRVMSYFERPQELRIARMVGEVVKVDYEKTDTVIEALILEARLIKKYQPQYNVLEKDDRSFLYAVITREAFPRVLLLRAREALSYDRPLGRFGPFTSAASLREAMHVLRRIFPWANHNVRLPRARPLSALAMTSSDHNVRLPRARPLSALAMTSSDHNVRLPRARPLSALAMTTKYKPCFDYQIGLCPGTCAGVITSRDYKKIIRQLIAFFEGKKQKILRELTRDMRAYARELKFEEAATIRRRIAALQHIYDIAVLGDKHARENDFHRVEGYDISHVSGTSAVGSMVVFTDGVADKAQYRKFRIKTVTGSNDVGMLTEVLRRRFSRHGKGSVIAIRQLAEKQSHNNVRLPRVSPAGESLAMTDSFKYDSRNDGFWPMPDLVLIDGGLPQVNAARGVLAELNIAIPVVGIAKGPERKRNDFFYPHELHAAVARNRDMLIRVRDEAHRFAIKYHRELRERLR